MSIDLNTDLNSWIFNTNGDDIFPGNSDTLAPLENTSSSFDFELIEAAVALTQMQSSDTPPSKKRPYSAYSSEENKSRKKMKVETITSQTSAEIDMLGVNVPKPDQYGPCTEEEWKSYLKVTELEKFEKWSNIAPPKNRDGYYYTAQTKLLPSRFHHSPTVLTGELEEHPIPDNASEALRNNLKTAKLIIDCVRNAIPFSRNYLQRSKIFRQEYFDPNCCYDLIKFLDTSQIELRIKAPENCPNRSLEYKVKETLKHKNGNCGHLAVVGYFLSKKFVSVELFTFQEPTGDHDFLVYDRNKAFLASDYKNWGPDAVVCDIWSGAFYLGSDVEKYLMDFKGIVYHKGIQYTMVQKFDPSKQVLNSEPL